MKTLSRYFIFSYFYRYDGGGASATIPVITTDGSYPNCDRHLSEHEIISNVLKVVHVSEVKSKQDLDDFFGYNVDISKHILN
ncbi:MAG TPA: hypothetical protein P5509_03300, partial [Bacteroidales bacterium]|nr:hypothetical protein [Bacteroidales bacterium]